MTTINDFLCFQSGKKRIDSLSAYLKEVAGIHQSQQLASINIKYKPSQGNNITVCPAIGIPVCSDDYSDNMVDCLSRLYPRYDRYLALTWHHYKVNKHKLPSLQVIEKAIYKKRKCREKNIDICFKNTDLFSIEKSRKHFQLIRNKYDSSELRMILSDPDQAIAGGELIKDCAATTVSIFTLSSTHKVIIKRYNSKGILYSLIRSLIPSRARVCWCGELLFQQIGIKTPENLAMLEVRKYRWIKKSYLITEYIQGQCLSTFFSDDENKEQWSFITQQIEDILFSFPSVNIVHGDFKSTNFIISESGPVMIDLDSVKSFFLRSTFKNSYRKDLDRFEENWVNTPSAIHIFQSTINNIRKHIQSY
ncbi:MAG: hypothetical protein QS748_10455 [Candidatus Endonucleobacter bathymodioli]|uniref:Uncharacterized protein n=1 Tax=Candidatus Endonucleibacter bathymodioli TaxID=539814 RepID=A0AA90STF6_9GAMM|nr:hypothetical protein [Candidatus Endonucleobacter bathymodioli]